MFTAMHVDVTGFEGLNLALGVGLALQCSFPEASEASRRERALQDLGAISGPLAARSRILLSPDPLHVGLFLSFLLFLPRQENETAAPAQGAAVACASSFNPGTVFQPVRSPAGAAHAQCSKLEPLPERRLDRQLVFVRKS